MSQRSFCSAAATPGAAKLSRLRFSKPAGLTPSRRHASIARGDSNAAICPGDTFVRPGPREGSSFACTLASCSSVSSPRAEALATTSSATKPADEVIRCEPGRSSNTCNLKCEGEICFTPILRASQRGNPITGTTFFFLSGNWQHGLFVAPAAGSAGTDTPNGAEQVIFNGAVQVSTTGKGHC